MNRDDDTFRGDASFERMQREEEREFEKQTKRKLERVERELCQLLVITMNIIGKSPPEQRRTVASAYSKFAEQNEMPNVRDVVREILAISDLPSGT